MAQKAAGKAKRTGVTLLELAQGFPDENAARAWFEAIVWPAGKRFCPKCGGENTHECSHAKMAYRCKDCHKHLQRYVNEFCGRHNIREMDTLTQMRFIARKLMGKHLKYQDLIAWLPHRELAIIAPSLHKGRGSAPRSIYPPAQPVLVAASSLQRLPSHIS